MNRAGILSVQLDRTLRQELRTFQKKMSSDLGRAVTESEAARVLLRRALDADVPLVQSGYVEGWRHGAAVAREAFARGAAEVKNRSP